MKEKKIKTKAILSENSLDDVAGFAKEIAANEVIIEQELGETVIKAETPKQKAVRLLSEKSEEEIREYAKKYDINPITTEAIAEFLVSKKPGSLEQNRIW